MKIDFFGQFSLEDKYLCSLGGGQGSAPAQQTQINKTEPWEGLKPYLSDVLAQAQTANRATPTTPNPNPILAPVDQNQELANQMKLSVAQNPAIAGAGNAALGLATDTLNGKYLNPNSNPAFMPALEATVRPMVTNLRDQVLPQLTSEAWNSGAYGGARHGLRESALIGQTQQNIGDTISKAVSDNYARERLLQTQAPQLAQSGTQLALAPADITSNAGAESRSWSQEQLDAALAQYQNELQAPWQALTPYANIVNGVSAPTSSTITGSQIAAKPSTSSSIFGGAVGGASLGSSLASILGVAGPWGALGGAALGGLAGLFR